MDNTLAMRRLFGMGAKKTPAAKWTGGEPPVGVEETKGYMKHATV
jgi:hypothetical protein